MSSECASPCRMIGWGLPFGRKVRAMSTSRSHPCLLAAGVLGALLGVGPAVSASSAESVTIRPSRVSTAGDLQAQVRATAAKVLPAVVSIASTAVSYTHLTLPTNREV